jgi:hypothetical protein
MWGAGWFYGGKAFDSVASKMTREALAERIRRSGPPRAGCPCAYCEKTRHLLAELKVSVEDMEKVEREDEYERRKKFLRKTYFGGP